MPRPTHISLTITILVLMTASVAAAAVRLRSIELCTDVTGGDFTAVNVTEQFVADTAVIHGVARVEGAQANSVLKGVWISIDAISVPNYEIDSAEVRMERNGPASGHFSLSRPTNGWPAGNYRLDVYADGRLLGSKGFSVSPPAEGQTTQEPVAATAESSAAGALAVKAGRTRSHPAGFSFWYPASWNIDEQDGMLQLIPAGAAESPEGPLELYFLATEDISGQDIQGPTDESVIEYLDEQVKSLSPVLEYTRRPSAIQTDAGKGAILVWQATAPDGRKISARVFVVFVRQTAVMLIGMGLQERIDARTADLQDLFKSITTGQVKPPVSTQAPTIQPQQPVPPVPATPTPKQEGPDAAEQLRALEAARQAGILSEEEYAAKKKVIEDRQAQSIDPAVRQKLEALESAFRVGILSEEEYNRKKAELMSAPAAPSPVQDTPALGEGVSPKAGGKTYRHAIGFSFWHPGDWTVKEHEEMLQLIPPNPSTTASGDPTEIYLIIGDNTVGDEGITRADDPRVAQFMDQAVAQLAPFLQRSAAPAAMVTATGKGVVMNWQGNSPSGGLVCARAYISVIKDSGISLVALCLRERLQAREAELQRIFTSFAFGEGQRDLRLAGTWDFLTTNSLTNWSPFETAYSRAQMASDTTGTLVIQPDGTWTRTYKTHMIAGAGGVWLESKDTKESRGTWYAGNGSLHLIWDDKSWQEYKYEMRSTPQGVRLLLTSGGKGELWERAK